jgi:hypothetical protein
VSDNVRVYELAKATGLGIDEVVRRLQQLGVDAKGNLSVVSADDAARLRDSLRKPKPDRKARSAPSSTAGGTARVYELAKETGLGVDEVVRRLQQLGVDAKGNLSVVSADDAARLRDSLRKPKPDRNAPSAPSSTPGGVVRIYELAKETGIDNDELVRRLRLLGVEVKSHLSSISGDDAARVRHPIAGAEADRSGAVEAPHGWDQEEALEHTVQEGAVPPVQKEASKVRALRRDRPGVTLRGAVAVLAAGIVGLVLGATLLGSGILDRADDDAEQPPELLAGSASDDTTSPGAAGETDPGTTAPSTSSGGFASNFTTPPGTAGDGFEGARDDVTQLRCERQGDVWVATGQVTNPTDSDRGYRIYVSYLAPDNDTLGLSETGVDRLVAGASTDWQGSVTLSGAESVRCVLRVERFVAG